MSDSAQIILRLDPLDPRAREAIVADLTAWLTDIKAIAPHDPAADTEGDGTSWIPGSGWRSAVEASDADLDGLEHNTVEISAAVEVHSAYENTEDPRCSRCKTPFPSDEAVGLIDDWLAGTEPLATCPQCGWSAILGDWPAEFPPALVGAPSIVFTNWPTLRPSFVDQVIEHLGGGRCRSFHQRL